eukprot:scaffold36949_cov69-Attheya_sp.AAC.1
MVWVHTGACCWVVLCQFMVQYPFTELCCGCGVPLLEHSNKHRRKWFSVSTLALHVWHRFVGLRFQLKRYVVGQTFDHSVMVVPINVVALCVVPFVFDMKIGAGVMGCTAQWIRVPDNVG